MDGSNAKVACDHYHRYIVKPGDMEDIKFPVDLFGINYYSRMTMKYETGHSARYSSGSSLSASQPPIFAAPCGVL